MKIALIYDWRDEDASGPTPDDLSLFAGQVVRTEYLSYSDQLVLTYADGRTVTVTLHQCKTHSCDDTCMVVEG